MPIGDVFELVLRHSETTYGTKVVNVFHFKAIDGAISPAGAAADYINNLGTAWKACFSQSLRWDSVTCRTLIPYGDVSSETLVGQTGADSSAMPTLQTAAIVTWRTGFPGRRKRGRTYVGGLYQGESSAGRLISSYTGTRLQPWATAMLNRYGPAGVSTSLRLGVWSRVIAGAVPPFDPAAFTQVTSFTVQGSTGAVGSRRVHIST